MFFLSLPYTDLFCFSAVLRAFYAVSQFLYVFLPSFFLESFICYIFLSVFRICMYRIPFFVIAERRGERKEDVYDQQEKHGDTKEK